MDAHILAVSQLALAGWPRLHHELLLVEAVLADHLYDLRSHITCLQLPHSSCYHLVQAATLRALIDLIAAIMVMALPKAQNCYSALKDKTNPCMHCSAGWTNSHLDLPSLT